MTRGDISLASSSGHYAWLAVVFSLLSILLYFGALCCSHLAAFRTAMENIRVGRKGANDELMQKNGLYRKLVDLQTKASNWKLSV